MKLSRMLRVLQKSIPNLLYPHVRNVRNFLRHLPHRWKRNRFCPVCEKYSTLFASFGSDPRKDAQCLRCGALERDRFAWLYLKRKTNLLDGTKKEMLHLAPEPALEPRLQRVVGKGYLTADLLNKRVMTKMDITNIRYPDDHFNVIFCSHVLEHVQDDERALRELSRVLNPDGWAILMVPIKADMTFEDESVTDPEEREHMFGQGDHVRIYGEDFLDRVKNNGFKVTIVHPSDFLSPEEVHLMGITSFAGEIFFCTKKSGAAR
jgi:SAM-dependent methyltransferase